MYYINNLINIQIKIQNANEIRHNNSRFQEIQGT